MRLWIWRHLRLELPEEWEMLQFGREQAAGRCAWADRYQFRFELDWRTAESRPDLRRMMGDYLAKLRNDGTMPDARPATAAGWPGIGGRQGGVLTTRFGTYIGPEHCIVETVFLWPETRDKALEAAVLASIGPEPEREGWRRWRAFGMDLRASADLPLRECVVQPAVARMTFGREGGRREERFQRLGMVSEWLGGSAQAWLDTQAPKDLVRSQAASATQGDHELFAVRGTRRPALLRPARRYDAAAWVCPRDGRLYGVATTGRGAPAVPLAGGRLCCCPDLERAR